MNSHTNKLRTILWAALALMLAMAMVLPLAAQDNTTDDLTEDDANTIIIGVYSVNENGDIIVTAEDGEVYIIAPAGAFNPSGVEDGDVVIIVGRELGDGSTIQAIEFDFFVEDEEADPEATPEATPEVIEEPVEEPVEEAATCGNPDHPVAARIAEEFDVSQEEVMAMHCDGNGFGNIARAFLLARALEDGSTAQDFLDAHHGGMGWGQIVKATGIHPSELAPGRIGKNKDKDGDSLDSSSSRGRGNGRGNNGNNSNRGNNGNNGNNGNGNSENRGGGKKNK